MNAQELKIELTNRLKNVRSIEELNALLKFSDSQSFNCEIEGKRRNYAAFGFVAHPHNPEKVRYLYCDGVSVGEARYENLYKVLHFRVWDGQGNIF